jgi:hypothetical protein
MNGVPEILFSFDVWATRLPEILASFDVGIRQSIEIIQTETYN